MLFQKNFLVSGGRTCLSLLIVLCLIHTSNTEVVWAVNCGGSAHVDLNGIEYMTDLLSEGISSDYGLSFAINRVPPEDHILYQTERYGTRDFSYDVPFLEDGDYVLTLKFSEVWFSEPDQKVFHVQINRELPLLEEIDIFGEVGFATALEKHIPIHISDGRLTAIGRSIHISGTSFSLDFIKTDRDNPKINAIVLTKGSLNDVPKLAPLAPPAERIPIREDKSTDQQSDSSQRRRPAGSPRAPDPYASTESSYWLLPILGSLAAFLPILFCLCKI